MRRFWIGIVILGVTLALGITVSVAMPRLQDPIVRQLDSAVLAAERGDWAAAGALTEDAAQRWQRCRKFTASVADHEPMETIDAGLAQTLAFLRRRDTEEFVASAAGLARSVRAMARSQSILWYHFL